MHSLKGSIANSFLVKRDSYFELKDQLSAWLAGRDFILE